MQILIISLMSSQQYVTHSSIFDTSNSTTSSCLKQFLNLTVRSKDKRKTDCKYNFPFSSGHYTIPFYQVFAARAIL